MSIIKSKNLVHEYIRRDEEGNVESIQVALDNVNLNVEPGQFISILGHNGSGKSTFAKHINALLTPSEGTLIVDGMNTSDDEYTFAVRQTAGMVFQNPDNQIIASVVDEDVAFGPENIGVPTEEIIQRVEKSLKMVGMYKYKSHSPNKLSGGQKQRVAIAGVMAMEPKCIILDEPTAMLDPDGRKDVLQAVHTLNKEKGITVILITHYMEEVVDSDYVFVMEKGKVFMEGKPREIFKDVKLLKEHSLDVPQVTQLAYELREAGVPLPECVLTRQELIDGLKAAKASGFVPNLSAFVEMQAAKEVSNAIDISGAKDKVLILDHVSYKYSPGTAYEVKALDDVSLSIKEGEFIGIIGHTGSGKSTLVQHLNGLIKSTDGVIYYRGQDIYDKDYDIKDLRTQVGMVFQYPEHQLFETTVFKDVQFGPKNQGLDEKEQIKRAYEALGLVGLPEEFYLASPFELSGGQKRRAAIAGVIAMKPAVIILDEPTAGLDPKGRDDILGMITEMHRKRGDTVILVSHSMEDVANYVDRIIVMDAGKPAFDGTPKQVFAHYKELEAMGLAAPQVTYVMNDLIKEGMAVDAGATTVEEAKASILKAFK
ncbi:energy-coupling factor transport system ATP-binding protein [Pseudobutyrivibrio sp. YE44]|uniref:energy-coupling factor transporter ATPase n=1 Tax=Pseudobutyrivibrio sp. YE44 TaxID=1520802 RepID=UPI00088B9075|nr:energy-coupling factor transporter ATPase [Pseudobutyrivibrio sp. YE44]SDB34498.1 energy-coupling factor transport system ATP-binding protein [Pseudobutyrivibrio sp. YE44]